MQTLALARKWRPKTFSELVGQTHVVEALTHALAQQRLHHAYLFSGTRGVGKTTLGRVFAKALNCEQGITPEPCGQCAACQAIDEGRFVDLIEIDAASRTKVEDTRELLDNVQYLPAEGRFKIYLIDEVHMLSTSSFNALLKTLEEPPEHVKFVLATTEPHKLPITVLSRCLKFNLQRLQPALIAEHLQRVAQAEGIEITTGALQLLAHHADGSVRDALSLLDQAVVQGSGRVDEQTVRDMLGLVSESALIALLDALAQQDAEALGQVLTQLAAQGMDYKLLLDALAEQFHHLALLQLLGAGAPDQNTELAARYREAFDPVRVQRCYQTALLGQKELQWAPSPRVAFEMAAMRMLAFEPVTELPEQRAQQQTQTPQKALSSAQTDAAAPATNPAAVKNGGDPIAEAPPLDTTPLVEPPTGEAALSGEAKQSVFSQLRAQIQGGASAGKPQPPVQAATPTDFPEQQAESTAPPAQPPEKPKQGTNAAPAAETVLGKNGGDPGAAEQLSPQTNESAVDEATDWLAPQDWLAQIDQLGLEGLTRELALNCVAGRTVQGWRLTVSPDSEPLWQQRGEALNRALGQVERGAWPDNVLTPARWLAEEAERQRQTLKAAFVNDPVVQALQARFDARIIESSIQPSHKET